MIIKSPLVRSILLALAWTALHFVETGIMFAQCQFPQSKERTLTYHMEPEVSSGTLVLHIRLEFYSSASGEDTVILPNEWAGETLHALAGLQALSSATSLENTADARLKVVRASPNRLVVIAYDLHKDWSGPFVGPLQFHPILMTDYLEFTGSNAFVRLQMPDGGKETANFDWQKLPSSWVLATSFGTTVTAQHRCQTYTGLWNKVNTALFSAGDFRIHQFSINGQTAYLAIRGSWNFPDEEVITDIQKIVGVVRSFWRDNAFPYFLVTVAPYETDYGGSDGSSFTNAFWMFLPLHGSLHGLLPHLAHESFHAWDPERMGIEPSGYNEGLIKWFREGPTDYYAHLLTYQAGELSAAEYIDTLNKLLVRFPDSEDEYVRGPVISLWLDDTIRKESDGKHSLEDAMYAMVRTANEPYTLERILTVIDGYLTPESRALLRQAVTNHGELPAPEYLPVLGDCAHSSLEQVPTYDLGFDADASVATHRVSGVVENGPAFRAGLRDDQQLGHISVYKHDPSRQAQLTIHTNGGDKQIAFYPRGKAIRAWQYRLDQNKACKGSS